MRSSISYPSIIFSLAFLLILFPYVTIVPIVSDIQPWACILAFVSALLLSRNGQWKKMPKSFIVLLSISAYACVRFGFSLAAGHAIFFEGIRSLWGYGSILIFAFFAYWSFEKITPKIFTVSVVVWTFGAMMQLFAGTHVLAPLLARLSTDAARGLTSFAPEPAFYAAFCMACFVLNELFFQKGGYARDQYLALQLLLVVQMMLAASGVGIVLLMACGSVTLLRFIFARTKTARRYALFSLGLIALSLLFQRYVHVNKQPIVQRFFHHEQAGIYDQSVPAQQKSRAASIITQSFKKPVSFVQKDSSTRYRLFNVVIGAYGGIIETKGIGMGIGSVATTPVPSWLGTLIGETRNFGGRIEGGFAQVVYEIGIVGVLYVGIIVYILIRSIAYNPNIRWVLIVSSVVVFAPYMLFGSISFPLLGYLLGIHLRYSVKKDDV
jgi:hypothetical protein